MSRAAQAQAQRQQQINTIESLELVKCLLRISIYHVRAGGKGGRGGVERVGGRGQGGQARAAPCHLGARGERARRAPAPPLHHLQVTYLRGLFPDECYKSEGGGRAQRARGGGRGASGRPSCRWLPLRHVPCPSPRCPLSHLQASPWPTWTA